MSIDWMGFPSSMNWTDDERHANVERLARATAASDRRDNEIDQECLLCGKIYRYAPDFDDYSFVDHCPACRE